MIQLNKDQELNHGIYKRKMLDILNMIFQKTLEVVDLILLKLWYMEQIKMKNEF